ncbi:hypothetical protein C8R46DRAFT_1214073 [Mycena filopes]|nr:hypothetical protein C8R46DRAFT_1214073 [Mycena filopes]
MSTPDFYCYPELHSDPVWDPTTATGYWLVVSQDAHAPGPGIYTSWEACSSVCEGVNNAGAIFFDSQEGCYPAWHAHCRLGDHNHPAEPQTPNPRPAVDFNPESPHFRDLHFAVRGGDVIYSGLESALLHYKRSAESGPAELIATRSYLKAFFFARGADEYEAQQLAGVSLAPADGEEFSPPEVLPGGDLAYGVSPRASRNAPSAPQQQEQQERQRSAASRARLAAIQAGVDARTRQDSQVQEKDARERLRVIQRFSTTMEKAAMKAAVDQLPPTPTKLSSKASSPKSRPSTAKPNAIMAWEAEKKRLGLGKWKGKARSADDGNESDALYAALEGDEDAELLETLKDWVSPEDDFDPTCENQPRDDK